MKKITVVIIFVAFLLSLGGFCLTPMVSAKDDGISEGVTTHEYSHVSGEFSREQGQCLAAHARSCGASERHVNDCAFSCSSVTPKVAMEKKIQDTLSLVLFEQGAETSPSKVFIFTAAVGIDSPPPGREEILLSVAKKE